MAIKALLEICQDGIPKYCYYYIYHYCYYIWLWLSLSLYENHCDNHYYDYYYDYYNHITIILQSYYKLLTGMIHRAISQVCQLKATRRAFAARRRDGRVVCWGDAAFGADPGHVEVPICGASDGRRSTRVQKNEKRINKRRKNEDLRWFEMI